MDSFRFVVVAAAIDCHRLVAAADCHRMVAAVHCYRLVVVADVD